MIPASIIAKLNEKEEAINFGSVTLKVVKHDSHILRYIWLDETSEVEDSPTSGEGLPKKQGEITENGRNTAGLPGGVRKKMRSEGK